MSNFATLIKEARKAKGYTQRQLAELLEVDYTYLSKIENGKTTHPPTEDIILSLAHYLDLDGEDLIYRAGRISLKDQKVIEQLAQTYGKDFHVLMRRLLVNPDQVRQVFLSKNWRQK